MVQRPDWKLAEGEGQRNEGLQPEIALGYLLAFAKQPHSDKLWSWTELSSDPCELGDLASPRLRVLSCRIGTAALAGRQEVKMK